MTALTNSLRLPARLRILTRIIFMMAAFSGLASATSPIHYVNAANANPAAPYDTWATAASTLQDALLFTTSGDQVWIAAGVYYPDEGGNETDNDKNASFVLQDGVSLYGGFAGGETVLSQSDPDTHLSILSGDLQKNDVNTDGNAISESPSDLVDRTNHAIVLEANGVENVTLDGLIVTAGYPNSPSSNDYGGFWISSVDTLTITRSRFLGNDGALAMEDSTNIQIDECTFSGNYRGLVASCISIVNSSPAISNCQFTGNIQNRAASVRGISSSPTFTRCTFSGNLTYASDGAAISLDDASASIRHCVFKGNSVPSFGGALFISVDTPGGQLLPVEVSNCHFSGNHAGQLGGAIVVSQRELNLSNSTFSGNQAISGSGGAIILANAATLTVDNCLLWNNQDSSGTNSSSASIVDLTTDNTITIRNSLVANSGGSGISWNSALGTDGGGNIDINPLFVTDGDPGTTPNLLGDFRLREGSPALDVGDNSLIPLGITTDLLGAARIQDTTIDMGAYEGGLSKYQLWAESKSLIIGVNDAPHDDPDGDGCPNLKEFAFDGNPLSGTGDKKFQLEVIEISTEEYLTMTFPVFTGTSFTGTPSPSGTQDGLTYTIQGTLDLNDWTEDLIEVTPADSTGLPPLSPGWEYRSFRTSAAISSPGNAFLRIGIAEVP